mgnify:CR=1 FL=1
MWRFAGKTVVHLSDNLSVDSWTFGWNVGSTQSYPQQLQYLLQREFPEANFEIFI